MAVAALREHGVLIVGGGCAGITVAHLLRRLRPTLDIAILEPSADHFHQPGWSLVGGGLMRLEQTRREEATLIPPELRLDRGSGRIFRSGSLQRHHR